MQSQFATIGMYTIPGKQRIEQPKATLTIEQPNAELTIQSKQAKVMIDQTLAWEDRNLMSTRRNIELYAEEGLRAVNEGTSRRAEQGTELMKIEQQQNAIVEQSLRNSFRQQRQISMKFIPRPFAVKIDVEEAELEIDVQIQKPIIDAIPNPPIHEYIQGALNIYMEKYAELEIDFDHLFVETV